MSKGSTLAAAVVVALLAVGQAHAGKYPVPYTAKGEYIIHVSPEGRDTWSGNIPSVNAKGSDGPLASLQGARDRIRGLREAGKAGKPVRVLIAPGTYRLTETLVLTPADSGTKDCPVTYEGVRGKDGMPVLSGGMPIGPWKPAGERLKADVPALRDGARFSSMWVRGGRRPRCSMPDQGFFNVVDQRGDDGKSAFAFTPGDIKEWPDANQAVISAFHQWENSYHRISSIDAKGSVVTLSNPANWPFWSRQRYRVENVRDALDQPGEWYADEDAGTIEYIPQSGETAEGLGAIIPRLGTLVAFEGLPEFGEFVRNVHMKGLSFRHTGFAGASTGHGDWQAANTVTAAIEAVGARDCGITGSEIAETENHGVWIRRGSRNFVFQRNEIRDFGAGGVRVGETSPAASSDEECGSNTIDNNFIHDGTKLFHGGCGVWLGLTSGNRVTHNDIGDLDYTGISVGWSWGYAESSANHNAIEWNRIHHLGRGLMSDMGGIYTLGVSPGTTERHNVIHDVYCYEGGYGGWGIYTDEGSSDILIENNLVYRTTSSGFHQHYGQGNTVRNNVFAFGRDGQLQRTRMEEHQSFTLERNLVLSNDQPILSSNWSDRNYVLSNNLYWDYSGTAPDFMGDNLAKWQASGRDAGSIIADPKLGDPLNGDFSLAPDSPALALGFVPFDTAAAGLYGDPGWVALPTQVARKPYEPAPPKGRAPIREDFEGTPIGQTVPGPVAAEDPGKGTVRVTGATAAEGKRSLEFRELEGVRNSWDPHLYYNLDYRKGTWRETFWLRVAQGTPMYHEWRDGAGNYRVGPSIEVTSAGKLLASGRTLLQMPWDTWVRITVTCGLGEQATGSYDVEVDIPGQGTQSFKATHHKGFNKLKWLGWVSTGTKAGTFYIDGVSNEPVK